MKHYIINTMKRSNSTEGVTLICTFSRVVFAPIFFKMLNDMDLPRKNIHLLVYDNTQDIILKETLEKELIKIKADFLSVRLYKSYLKGRGNIRGSGNEQFRNSKLYNIWHMWKRLFIVNGGLVYTPTFFQLEDDTIAPPNAFKVLFKTLFKNDDVAMVTAIETGRANVPWIPVGLGVHRMKMKGLFCLERRTLNPDTKGIVEIDGSGVYCFAARTDAYKTGFDGYNPVKLNVPFFGLDNIFVWNIKKHGYKILADFSLWCSHLEASAGRIIAFSKDQAIEMLSFWVPKANNYVQGLEVKKKGQKPRRYRVKKHAPTWEI